MEKKIEEIGHQMQGRLTCKQATRCHKEKNKNNKEGKPHTKNKKKRPWISTSADRKKSKGQTCTITEGTVLCYLKSEWLPEDENTPEELFTVGEGMWLMQATL